MNEILDQLADCVERGKINAASPHPPDMKGQDGADELARKALEKGIHARDVLARGLMVGMTRVGEKFRDRKIFVPDVLMAAKAMSAAMEHLKPYFKNAQVKHRGTIILGTVKGDLHDIGKKLVGMVFEGAGWEVVDLGIDVPPEKFIGAIRRYPGAAVGMSALLSTTMLNMEETIRKIREAAPGTRIIVGGAPLTKDFADKIGADAYSPDPQGAVEYLNSLVG